MSQTQPRPNFFIVGAPKSGTTAMHTYLSQHPEVWMSQIKEPHFFASDLEWVESPRITRADYLALFAGAGPQHRVIGESSVFYLRSEQAAREIAAFAPEAKILIMLRDPVEMIYSFHSQRVYNGTEDLDDFRVALDAEGARARGERLPRVVGFRQGMFYRLMGLYAEQCRRFTEAFPPGQVLIELYDDFRADTAASFRRVCEHLDIDAGFEPDFERVNANTVNRFPALRQLVLQRPAWMTRVARAVVPTRGLRGAFTRAVNRINTSQERRAPLDPDTRAALRDYYAEDLDRLGTLLGRDLSAWS